MDELSGHKLLDCVRCGYKCAKAQTCQMLEDPTNAAKNLSSKFVSEVACKVHTTFFSTHCLNVIRVGNCGKREPGEWLVDACITKNKDGFIDKIVFAMESESSPALAEFQKDFAKLLHLNADVKLYLSGLNQGTEAGMENHIHERIEVCKCILRRAQQNGIQQNGQLFVGFWPSPSKPSKPKRDNQISAWEELPSWLDQIRMWDFGEVGGGCEPREISL